MGVTAKDLKAILDCVPDEAHIRCVFKDQGISLPVIDTSYEPEGGMEPTIALVDLYCVMPDNWPDQQEKK